MSYHYDYSRVHDEDLENYYGFLPAFPAFVSPSAAAAAVPEDAELVGVDVLALSPIESSSGLKGVLLEVLGPYDNIVTQYKYQQNTSTNYTYVNEVTPDYPWIASAALFIVLIWSLFGLVRRSLWLK